MVLTGKFSAYVTHAIAHTCLERHTCCVLERVFNGVAKSMIDSSRICGCRLVAKCVSTLQFKQQQQWRELCVFGLKQQYRHELYVWSQLETLKQHNRIHGAGGHSE